MTPRRFIEADRSNPVVDAKPVDGELRRECWKLYDEPVLNWLIEQAMAANPDLQVAAEKSRVHLPWGISQERRIS
jgi:outer membrane protein TolC